MQQYQVYDAKYQVPVCTCFCTRHLAFFKVDCPLSSPPPENYTRTADQNVASSTSTQHSAQHRATIYSSAQALLGIINSLVAPNHGPLLSAPVTCLVAFFHGLAKRAASVARVAEPLYLLLTCPSLVFLLQFGKKKKSQHLIALHNWHCRGYRIHSYLTI